MSARLIVLFGAEVDEWDRLHPEVRTRLEKVGDLTFTLGVVLVLSLSALGAFDLLTGI